MTVETLGSLQMQSHLWMIMITVVTAVVALAAALVVTAPVLMIVDSSTLDRKDGVDHWRRVTASFLYFGSLGVALWKAAKSSPTPEASMDEWPTSLLAYFVCIWCFIVVFIFSVVVTSLHAYRHQKIYFSVVLAAILPALVHGIVIQRISVSKSIVVVLSWAQRIVAVNSFSGVQDVVRNTTRNGSMQTEHPIDQARYAEEAQYGMGFWAILELAASNALLAIGAGMLAFLILVCVVVPFATEWRGTARILYCVMLTSMLGSHGGGFTMVWAVDLFTWLHVWRLLTCAYWLLEIIVLLILPISWALFSRETVGDSTNIPASNQKTRKSILIALLPTVIFITINALQMVEFNMQ